MGLNNSPPRPMCAIAALRVELAARAQSALIGVAEADLYPSFSRSGFVGLVAADATSTTRTGSAGVGHLVDPEDLAVTALV